MADLHGSAEPRQPLRVLKYRPGMASELLIRCKYFEVYRMLINTERRQTVHYRADRMAFRVLLCMDGCGTVSYTHLDVYKRQQMARVSSSVKAELILFVQETVCLLTAGNSMHLSLIHI